MLKKLYDNLSSLTLGLWLLTGLMLFLAIGSFMQGEGSSINEVALYDWLRGVPLRESWWLVVALIILVPLAMNTFFCSIESLRSKWQRGGFLLKIAPQLMHLAFLFIVIAHLQSAYGGFKQGLQVENGSTINFPDGTVATFTDFSAAYGKMGMPTAYSATLEMRGSSGVQKAVISPNSPHFYKGYGIYIKDIAPPPMKAALVEIHREPGAMMALTGGALFTCANIILLARRREKTA